MIKAELVIHPKAFITTFRARSFGEILEQARDALKKFFKKNKKNLAVIQTVYRYIHYVYLSKEMDAFNKFICLKLQI